ncbi:histidine acid phosphatase [Ancylostoma caninum]|uniref:Histidine acid phosphatase n=1 Tax=Ancylostoma caninum TaxID=29170 RepID=A0A368GNX5_ANCCA|nr:histidine acid phosphatase [Ancylostoma caninum]
MNGAVLLPALVLNVVAEVVHVQVLFRHGDRAPSNVYPLDPYGEKVWPRGFSQLTEQGYRRAQELGEYLRVLYGNQHNLLGSEYHRKEVYIRSSDKDRCIETAMGVASTMFPSQVVPVHTYSSHKHDLLLKPSSVRCDRADMLVSGDKQRLYHARNQEYKDLFAFLSHHTGMHVSMSNVKDLYNIVHRESENGLLQPTWVYESTSRNTTVIEELAELKRQERMETFNSYEKSKLSTGFLLGQMLQEMRDKVLGISPRKMMLYSTHDATITSLLYSLDSSNHLLPPYTSAILLELHRIDNQHFVKLLFRNSTEEPALLQLPFCSVLCPWKEFERFAAPRSFRTRDEFEEACDHQQGPEQTTLYGSFFPTDVVAIAGYLLLLVSVVQFYNSYSNNRCSSS